jgi:hypothetical protein
MPFLLRFAEPISDGAIQKFRYDEVRQVSQVEVCGKWIDATDAAGDIGKTTRVTKVAVESTDDE